MSSYDWKSRFGAIIAGDGISVMPMAVWRYQQELDLKPEEVWFIGYILAHQWTEDYPYPALENMAKNSRASRASLFRYSASLQKKGYLRIVPRFKKDTGRTSNGYDFGKLFGKIEELIKRDAKNTPSQYEMGGTQSLRPTPSQNETAPVPNLDGKYKQGNRSIEEGISKTPKTTSKEKKYGVYSMAVGAWIAQYLKDHGKTPKPEKIDETYEKMKRGERLG